MVSSLLKAAALLAGAAATLGLLVALPAQAHHLIDLGAMAPTPLNGLLSGLAHPVIGPDHLLFLLSLTLVALRRPLTWVITLLGVGLLGSAAGLLWPAAPGADVLVSLSLVVEALVILERLPAALLLPSMALHGYVLSAAVLGWTSMPIATYLLGLLVSQLVLLVLTQTLIKRAASALQPPLRRLLALALIGLGGAWALAQVVA
jgi:urease accessory protein